MTSAIAFHSLIRHLQICLNRIEDLGLYAAAAHLDSAINIMIKSTETEKFTSVIDFNRPVDFTQLDILIEELFR